ncbi:hypothetical protein G4B88_002827 [Cannabis sativa]|uniref:Uncharacterized protein n=1 Tax=Cannabis sativa TaxID=3483 RepID=A0A7J6ECP6_CANSA|nr:hypothetical protein G4B88_002827 [Cannabis sativa]
MGYVGNLFWFNNVNSKKKKKLQQLSLKSLFFRLKAALKKATKNNGSKRHFSFQYDPSSYALNFDDGSSSSSSDIKNIQWVYVLWIKCECE